MTTDYWKDQYKKMIRHKEYIRNMVKVKKEMDHELVDAFNNFFIQCLSLKDWLEESGYADAELFFNTNKFLNTCGGIANGTKHFKLRNKKYINQYHRQFINSSTISLLYSTTGHSPSSIKASFQPKNTTTDNGI